jgi:hydrogenase-4 component F
MLLQTLIFLPLLVGLSCFFVGSDRWRRGLLVTTAAVELVLAAYAATHRPEPAWGGVLDLDGLGALALLIACVLFLLSAVYGVGYLQAEVKGKRKDFQQGLHFVNAPEAVFTACLLVFLAAMALVTCTQHLGLLWVGVETTTLASAPLIYFHRHVRSLEATWKYLIICSVGIALALLGNILLTVAVQTGGEAHVSMVMPSLLAEASNFHPTWLKAAFVFVLVGYGTKMGLAPMHTWLPDAHSESPSLVSALLSGALLNTAFLGILRAHRVCQAAGLGSFSHDLLVAFGLLSLLVAAVFIVGQGDFKRMLAYSSVEHMGLLALAAGLGGAATAGGMLHMVNHSMAKAALFLTAGNILAKYHTKSSHDVTGLLHALPVSGPLWLAGFLAIAGSPPFGPFVSEFAIVKAAMDSGRYGVAAGTLVCLAVIFVGMATAVLHMSQGRAPHGIHDEPSENWLLTTSPALLVLASLCLGLYQPHWLQTLLASAVAAVR